MSVRRAALWSLGVLLALLAVGLWGGGIEEEPVAPPPPPARDGAPLSGFVFEANNRSGPDLTLRFTEMVRERRRLGPFTINAFSDLVLRGVELTFRLEAGGAAATSDAGDPDPWPQVLELARASGSGNLTRLRLERLRIEAVHAGASQFVVRADQARVLSGSGALDLRGAVRVTTRHGDRLDAAAGRWDGRGWRLAVAGPWTLRSAAGADRGSDGVFALDAEGALRRLAPAAEQREEP